MREHHIPLRTAELVQKLADDPAVTIFDRELFRQFCQLVQATIHHGYRTRLEALQAAYAPFDPDSDLPLVATELRDEAAGPDHAASTAHCRKLFEQFDALLMRANYRRLSRDDLEAALRAPNHTGLELALDLKIFERLEIYVRGSTTVNRSHRHWRSAWREQVREVPVHRRLALIFRLRKPTPATDPLDTRSVVLKLFKDIPQQDVETLLPGGAVRITWFEQAKIILPTLSGIGLTLFKLLKGAAAVAFVSLYGLLAFLALISGTVGYGLRSFYGYLRTREKHQLSLTRHLYFQNLDNNAGVIYHLLAEAEEQEFREVVLAYWLLWRGGMAGASGRQLDQAAERWLHERCGLTVDFEIADALAKLQGMGLAACMTLTPSGPHAARTVFSPGECGRQSTSTSAAGLSRHERPTMARWRAVPIEAALAKLDRAWDECFDYHQPVHEPAVTPVSSPRLWRAAA